MSIFGKPKPCEEAALQRVLPAFCGVCGSVLVLEVIQKGYHEATGCRMFDRWLRCPRWEGGEYKSTPLGHRWARRVATNGHDWLLPRDVFSSYLADYLDCSPAYVHPVPDEMAAGTGKEAK